VRGTDQQRITPSEYIVAYLQRLYSILRCACIAYVDALVPRLGVSGYCVPDIRGKFETLAKSAGAWPSPTSVSHTFDAYRLITRKGTLILIAHNISAFYESLNFIPTELDQQKAAPDRNRVTEVLQKSKERLAGPHATAKKCRAAVEMWVDILKAYAEGELETEIRHAFWAMLDGKLLNTQLLRDLEKLEEDLQTARLL
jgi:hypothetical protein